jgi:hypothetical protein
MIFQGIPFQVCHSIATNTYSISKVSFIDFQKFPEKRNNLKYLSRSLSSSMNEILDIATRLLGPAITLVNMVLAWRDSKGQQKARSNLYEPSPSPFGLNPAGCFD